MHFLLRKLGFGNLPKITQCVSIFIGGGACTRDNSTRVRCGSTPVIILKKLLIW